MLYNMPDYSAQFTEWLAKPAGKKVIQLEAGRLAAIIPTLFGYDAVILGHAEFANCIETSPIKHKVLLNPDLNGFGTARVCTRLDKLAIATESIDLVYLAHCLEFSNNPHEILREAYRILRPDGHLLITAFNPLSLFGIWRMAARFSSPVPWRSNFMSIVRLKDWLALLGFDIMQVNNFGFLLPFNCCDTSELSFLEAKGQRYELPFGAGYILEASKRVMPLTPIKPVWNAKPDVVSEDVTEPTA